ncbi:MAG: hypothetical protein GC181_14160 [Bacteroidetes bacterium]|nr:hypothetical protein [Bacteroidota bacterium]
MYIRLFLVLLQFAVFSFFIKSQSVQIGFSKGLVLPIGNYGSRVIGNEESGFAKRGNELCLQVLLKYRKVMVEYNYFEQKLGFDHFTFDRTSEQIDSGYTYETRGTFWNNQGSKLGLNYNIRFSDTTWIMQPGFMIAAILSNSKLPTVSGIANGVNDQKNIYH